MDDEMKEWFRQEQLLLETIANTLELLIKRIDNLVTRLARLEKLLDNLILLPAQASDSPPISKPSTSSTPLPRT